MQTFINSNETPAPKDGQMLLLVVKIDPDGDEWFPTEDSSIFRTIGFNSLADTGEDIWECAGWNWCGDHFQTTTGEIIGWLPLPKIPDEFLDEHDNPDQ